ncbi:centrosomal protein of 97 kDa-like [Uloborus diversus]|uniref:centrosomal protein of 97 kDa-like n=1 Tax=Uloborus diversus TaxID=327109 RepID=UPI00240A908D|nr:centrosomal protein of 97 kDa-like [Uloborus diversus]
MAGNEKYVLDLSGAGIKKLEKRDGIGIKHLILDNNELTKLEHLECFPDVEKVSASGNAIVRMFGVSKCHHITHLNLPNNNIISIDGRKEIPNLVFLNLSVNNLKLIQNLQFSVALVHLDVSRNNISTLSDISYLVKLKTLHLNGNKISTLNRASSYLPTCITTLSLADNCIADLNEVSYLVKLHCLEQLTVSGNPCLSFEDASVPPFDYRPFVINWCLGLRLLDGRVATQKESLKAEWLYSQGKGRHYKSGEHLELVEYLTQVCPVTADESAEEEDEKLLHILHMQRQHKEQFLNEQSQVLHSEASAVSRPETISSMAQSYHFKTDTSIKTNETDASMSSNIVPSKIMYESAPDVLFHCTSTDTAQTNPPSFQSGKYPRSVSKSEILHSSIKSPITIEQVAVEVDSSNKPVSHETAKSSYQYYEDRRVRPSNNETKPAHTQKGTLIRKVSKRATSPSTASPMSGRSKLPHSTLSKSRISPSRSCILTPRFSAAAKNSSESDTSEELAHSNRTPQRSFRSLSTGTTSGNNSPVLQQKFPVALSPTKKAFGFSPRVHEEAVVDVSSKLIQSFPPPLTKSKTMSEIYGKSEKDIMKAATKIQSVWRGYFVRHHNQRVCKLLQEIRFRRLEDHIQHLHGHLCRLTDFVLRQQQDLQHERELRKSQAEDIRHLHQKARDLQKSVSVALSKAKPSVFQNASEHDMAGKELSRENSLSDSKFEKLLPGQSSESLNLALRYSTQSYQENSGLYSPSSQTSSVTSSVPDTTYSRPKSQRDLQPSTSDVSDADSGMQSMVSPNVATADSDRNASSDVDHPLLNGYTSDVSGYPCFKRDLGSCVNQRNTNRFSVVQSERDINCEDSAVCAKLNLCQSKNAPSRGYSALTSFANVPEEAWSTTPTYEQSMNLIPVGKMHQKLNFMEYPNSSVESSPMTSYPPSSEDCINSLTRMNNDGHSYHNIHPNTLPNHISHAKQSIANKKKIDLLCEKDSCSCSHHGCSVLGAHHHAKDKVHMHHSRCPKSCSCKHAVKMSKSNECNDSNCSLKTCAVLPKGLNQLAQGKVTTPLEDIDSPQSPCTVEMSGHISHSCSFQSDGFTAAEELSATATVKLFSTRAVSMTCTNGTLSPQTSSQRPLSLSDSSPQTNLRSPLVLAASVWEKKVQDIESTFHQLQTQIRDLEGAFGHIGQFGQFFYPGILQEDVKEPRPAIHCAEPASGTLALDMPKINFKRPENGNNDLLFQTRFAGNVPFLSHASGTQHSNAISNDFCIEELDQDLSLSEETKDIQKSPVNENHEANKNGS